MPAAELPLCQCGCGEPVARRLNGNGWCTYATPSCKARAFRQRNAGKVYQNRNTPVVLGEEALAAVETAARAYGIAPRLLRKVVERMAGRGEASEVPARVTNEYLVDKIEQVAARVLASIDNYDIATADLKGKTSAVRGFVELRQLLKGEPTEIRGYQDRSKMMANVELLLREAGRRGIPIKNINLPPSEFEETP